jgi:hypothetical protein
MPRLDVQVSNACATTSSVLSASIAPHPVSPARTDIANAVDWNLIGGLLMFPANAH